jgi:hypothetical protein
MLGPALPEDTRMNVVPRCSIGIVSYCGHHVIDLGCLTIVSNTMHTWCRGPKL